MARDELLQAFSLQPFHDDEGVAVVVFNAMDRADIGVVQKGCSPSFAREPLERFGIPGQILRDELQGHMAAELEVLGLIHDTHTTASQFSKDAVMRYLLADHERARGSAVMLGPSPHPVNCVVWATHWRLVAGCTVLMSIPETI